MDVLLLEIREVQNERFPFTQAQDTALGNQIVLSSSSRVQN